MENPVLIDYHPEEKTPYSNITLRDLFAGLAMHGSMSSYNCNTAESRTWCAQRAYQVADVMLKARGDK